MHLGDAEMHSDHGLRVRRGARRRELVLQVDVDDALRGKAGLAPHLPELRSERSPAGGTDPARRRRRRGGGDDDDDVGAGQAGTDPERRRDHRAVSRARERKEGRKLASGLRRRGDTSASASAASSIFFFVTTRNPKR
mmetsp:Transcript_9584/g.23531  ORF Transcript_9584/g.23531 Transcript_9584/m.23531 type:complete len:138 (+) Transcript_9584:1613-2026(+)